MNKLLIIFFFLSLNVFSQRDWKTDVYYKSKGKEIMKCDSTIYEKYSLNSFGGKVLTGYYRKCKVLNWIEEYYNGYVNIWFKDKWETEWIEGSAWKCYWTETEMKATY